MVAKGFIGVRVKFARFYVSLDLAIPCGCVKFGKPPPKLREFLGRKSGDPPFQRIEFAHPKEDTTSSIRGLTPSHFSRLSGLRALGERVASWRQGKGPMEPKDEDPSSQQVIHAA
jgi:hypothetical protein